MREASIAAKAALFSVAGIAGVVSAAAKRAERQADEASRLQEIERLKTTIVSSYPRRLSDRLLAKFEASGNDLSLDFPSEIANYYDARLYNFLLEAVGEKFADQLFERKSKFARFEVPTSLADLSARTAADLGIIEVKSDEIESVFSRWLENEDEKYNENLRRAADEEGIPDLPALPGRQGPYQFLRYKYFQYENRNVDAFTREGWKRFPSFEAFEKVANKERNPP